MKVVITGGGGFLGSQLAKRLLERGTLTGPSGRAEPIDSILLFDTQFAPPVEAMASQEGQAIDLTLATGDMGDRDAVFAAAGVRAAAKTTPTPSHPLDFRLPIGGSWPCPEATSLPSGRTQLRS